MKDIAEKLIIENRTDQSSLDIMPYISHVLRGGKISDGGKQYCYITTWPHIQIFVVRNKNSFRFVVTDN